jgi:hypothetical protein
VARLEDVLEVYHRPSDDRRPLVCLDKAPVQLIGETRTPLPPRPGRPERYGYEYVRNGTANLLLAFEPLVGGRSRRPNGAPPATSPSSCAGWSWRCTPTRRRWRWSPTI